MLGIVHQEITKTLMPWQKFTSQNQIPSQQLSIDIPNAHARISIPGSPLPAGFIFSISTDRCNLTSALITDSK